MELYVYLAKNGTDVHFEITPRKQQSVPDGSLLYP